MGDDTAELTFEPWIKRYPGTGNSTGATLVFPHAGGAAIAYRALGSALAAGGADAYVMQYPQRGNRLTHPASATVGELAAELFDSGEWARLGPLRLFGHCFGAVVAFEFARIAERHGVEVVQLWASASEAPSDAASSPSLPTAEAEIISEMVDLGGTDPQLLADEDFVELLLMAVRADYTAYNRYACDADVRIAADIHTIAGDSDRRIGADTLRGWQTHTTGAFTLSLFDGGHFYVNDQIDDVAGLINEL
jgi:surfactin synthase thioesterase subunit